MTMKCLGWGKYWDDRDTTPTLEMYFIALHSLASFLTLCPTFVHTHLSCPSLTCRGANTIFCRPSMIQPWWRIPPDVLQAALRTRSAFLWTSILNTKRWLSYSSYWFLVLDLFRNVDMKRRSYFSWITAQIMKFRSPAGFLSLQIFNHASLS